MFTFKKKATGMGKKNYTSRNPRRRGQSAQGGARYGVNFRALKVELLEPRTLLSSGGTDDSGLMVFDHVIFDPATGAAVPAATAQNAYGQGALSPAGSLLPANSPSSASSTPWASSAPVGLVPVQIRTAYGINLATFNSIVGTGAGQTIAIIDVYDDPNIVSDVAAFNTQFGLQQFNVAGGPTFVKLNESGAASPLPAASGSSGWSMEESLDVEWAHAIAPQANIILFEANGADNADLISTAVSTARSYPGVSVVSMSFGESESSSDTGLNSLFTTPASHGGVTFLASTGDSGSPGGFPAYSPNVVAAGGTTLTLSGNNYVSETGWSDSGGGQSTYESEPSYQLGVQTSGWRQIPDVSFDADPNSGVTVYDSYDEGSSTPWVQVGGTSVASPCWAGLVAIGDQFRTSVGLGTMDGPTQTLPLLYGMKAADFHDITSGSNGGFSAHAGYDEVTGIGTPVANNLLPAFVPVSSKGTVAFSASQYVIGTSATITVGDLDLNGNPSCPVTLTSSAGDSETLSLAAQRGGIFTGSIVTSAGTVAPGDGILETVPGGTITVTYHDANDGTGNPATVTATATTFNPLQITTPSPLPTALLNQPYSVTLTATGGIGAYTWSTASTVGNYTESNPGTGWMGGGTAQGWHADDESWSLTLPFAFPFYGNHYNSVWVDSNGFLDFTTSAAPYIHSDAALEAAVRIAPIWEDLVTTGTGNDIFVTSTASYVAVRWDANTYSGGAAVNVEAVLYPNGNIEFNYGPTVAALSPTIGVSAGDGVHYTLSSLDNAASISPNVSLLETAPQSLPPGLSLSSSGVLSGTPTGTAANYNFPVTVVDTGSPRNSATESVALAVSVLPPLTVTVPANATEGVGTVDGTVTIPTALASPLVVSLASSDTNRLTVPASVTILAGQTSAVLPITIINTGLLDGPEAVVVTATASGYLNATGTIEVHDDLTATLSMSLPASAPENGGTVTGTITSSAAPSQNISVALTSSGTTHLTVPATVTLPAGQTSVNFTATLLDDHIIESGPMPVTVTAAVENWTSGTATINILDEDATMAISLPASGWKGQTLSGTVQIGGTLAAPLVVSLASSNTTQLTLPATVTIPAGSVSATFTATLVDNGLHTGPETAQVTATASGLPTATANVVIDDSDVDHYTWSTIAGPETDGVAFSVTATARDFLNNPILVYDGSATLSATGQAGSLSITPTTVTFVNGTWTGNVTVNAADPTVTLHLANAAGAMGTSNVFAIQAGAVASFQWGAIVSPQSENIAFPVTLTAKDANGYTATGFNGSTALTGWMNGASSVVPAPGAPIASGNIKLLGTDLQLGVNADGSLVDEDVSLGANYLGDDFLLPGSPFAAISLAVNGNVYHNAAASDDSSNPMTMTVQNVSAGGVLHAQATGGAGGIQVTRDIWFQPTSDAVSFHVQLQNTTAAALSNVAWMEAYDPDQGYSLAGSYNTDNNVLFGGQYVEAVYYYSPTYPNGLTIAMGSNDPRAVAGAQGFNITSPFTVINGPVNPGGASADVNSNLAFNIGTLAAGASTTLTYYMVFATNRAAAASLYQAQLRTPVPITPTAVTFTNGVATTNITVQQTATAMYLQADDGAGQVGTSNTFNVLALPPLTLTVPANTTEGNPVTNGTISIPAALGSDLVVNLASSDTNRLTVPASVTIPGGQTSVSVPITTINTGLLDGPEAVTVTATASGYLNATGTIEVHDDLAATLSMSLPASAPENGGTVTGTITSSAAPSQNISVALTSSGTTHLTVPATVTLPAGQTSVNFTATLLDDHIIESSPMPVTVTAAVENWTSGTATINILDEDATMAISLPASGWKGQTLSGTVQIGGTLTTPLVVSLASSNTTQLTVPATVTIPAGSVSTTFTATLVDNGLHTGPETAQVTATASGLPTATANVVIDDADVDHYTFSGLPTAIPAGTSFPVTVRAYDVDNNLITVCNATVPLSATGVGGTLVVSPTSLTFVSGVCTASVTVSTADPAATLKLNNGIGATGTSSPIDVYAPLAVLSTSPPVGGALTLPVPAAAVTLNVTFNQPITPASITTGSLVLSGITGATVGAVSILPGNTTASFTISGITSDGTLTASIAAGKVLDQNGYPNVAFSGSYITDIVTQAFPVPLVSVAPAGSLIYDGTVSDILAAAGLTHTYTLAVDPLQTISVLVTPTSSALQPSVQLLSPTGTTIGTATAAAANQDALIQATTTTGTTTGTYQIVVGGAGSTLGNYTVQVTLNAALDAAAYLAGTSNGTLATAQPLDGSFQSLTSSGIATRGAVLGSNVATVTPWNNYYSVNLSAGDVITAGLDNLSGSGTAISLLSPAGVVLASGVTGPTNLAQAISSFTIPAGGTYYFLVTGQAAASYDVLITRNAAFSLLPNGTFATAQNVGGTHVVLGALGGPGGSGIQMGLIQDVLPWGLNTDTTVATGLGYTVTLIPSSALATTNLSAYSMIVLAGDQSSTTYSTVQADLPLIQSYVSSGGVWVVNNANGNLSLPYGYSLLPGASGVSFVALGGTDINVLAPTSGLINGPGGTITNTTLDGGTYSDHGYTSSTMPAGGTAILSTATASQVVCFNYPDGLGQVIAHTIPVEYYGGTGNFGIFHENLFNFAASFATTSTNAYYIDQLTAGQSVHFATSTPADGSGEFENSLSPHIQLYDPSGNLVASGTVGADGRNETIDYTPLLTGAYGICVTAKSSTQGEYVLSLGTPLTLALPANETEGVGTVNGTLSVPVAPASNLTVSLVSSDPSRLTVPTTVTIPAGQTSVSVPITIVNTGLLDGPEAVTISAAAPGCDSATGTIEVHSGLTATLNVSLPASAPENGGTVTGTITSSAAPSQNISVALSSSGTTHLTVPATVTLPAGQTSVNFTATLLDDHVIETSPMPVTVTAAMDNWTSGVATIDVLDEDATMAISLPVSGWKGQTLSGTVEIGGTLATPLVVSLASSNITQLTLPATVTIPAGSVSATFTATLVDNGLHTGPETAQVTATASGLPTATANVVIDDADVDHYTFSGLPTAIPAGTAFPVTVRAYDVDNNPITVCNATVPLSATGVAGTLVVSPTSLTFVSGVCTASVTVSTADPAATLKVNNGVGATGTSSPIDVYAPLAVLSTGPAVGGVLTLPVPAAAVTLNVNFNQPITASSVTTSTLVLSGISGATVSAVNVLPGNTTASFTLSGITSDGTLTASIAAGAVLDQYGYPNVAFSGSYITDIVTQAFPVPLTSVAPAGSLIYNGTDSDILAAPGLTHTYTLAVDPLQTISVLVTPTSSTLQPSVQLLSPTGTVIGTATAAAAGQDALIQATATTGTATGTYQIIVGGAGSTVGNYTVQVTLNAALDAAAYLVSASNGTLATAQPLDGSFQSLSSSGNATRGAVLGSNAASATPWNNYYSVNLSAGDVITAGLDNLSGSGTAISLLSPAGVALASGATGPTNLSQVISGFSIPAGGTYYLLVTGQAAATYDVVVTRNAAFDTHPNSSFATAQSTTGTNEVLGAIAGGGVTTLTFGELPYQPVNGLTFDGVTFGYTIGAVGSTDADYDSGGPGTTAYTQDPSLEGLTTGLLTLNFSQPSPILSFGMAISAAGATVSNAATVSLFTPSSSLIGTFTVSVSPLGYTFPSGEFVYAGPALVGEAVINFNSAAAGAFVVDNLSFGSVNNDWYSVNIPTAGVPLTVTTGTPADGSGEFENSLSPHIQLYDPSGNLLAGGTVGADGRNETIYYTPAVAGTYYIQVTAKNSTQGEYVLTTQQGVPDTNGPTTTNLTVTPALANHPPTISATVSDPLAGNAVVAAEYFVDTVGANGSGIALSGTSPSPTVNVSGTLSAAAFSGLAQGTHTIYVHGENGAGYWGPMVSVTFVKDTIAPVVSVNPLSTLSPTPTLSGGVNDPTATVQVTVAGQTYPATNNGDGTWTLPGSALAAPLVAGVYNVQVAGTDPAGNVGTDSARDLTVNPLATAQSPAGSLVYSAPIDGNLSSPGLTDVYTVTLDAGETVSLGVDPSSTLQPTATICGPSGATLGSAAATMLGSSILVETVTAATTGNYTLCIGAVGSTTGTYTATFVLNAAIEGESYGGATNNTLATAQDLTSSFVSLGPGTADRGAVLGNLDGSQQLLVNGGFETGNFTGWTATSSGGSQLTPWTVSPAYGGYFFNSQPLSGSYDALNGFDGAAGLQYQLYQNVTIPAGATSAILTTWDRIVYSGNGTGTQSRTFQITLRDTSNDVLQTLYTQQVPPGFAPVTDLGWQMQTFNLSAYAGQTVRVFFSETIPQTYTGPAMLELDNLSLAVVVPAEDWYSFPLTAGESATIGLESAAGSGINLQVYNAAQNLLAQGISAANLSQVINNFVAPATGTYYLRVSGTGSTYNLFVTRNADFDTEPNAPVTWPGGVGAQTLSAGSVLGAVTTGPNWYKLTLAASGDLSLSTSTPGSGTGQFANTFDPYLALYDASGTLLASANNNLGGTNAEIDQPLAAGTYFVEIAAPPLTPTSQGEYVLSQTFTVDSSPPVVSVGNTGTVMFIRGGSAVAVAPNLTVADSFTGHLLSATVSLSGGTLDAGAETLAANTTGTNIVASYNGVSGVLTLSGNDTLADYRQVLRSVTYVDTQKATTNTANRTLSFCVSDMGNVSTPVSSAVAFDVAPEIVGVYVSGSAWKAGCFSALAAAGVGSATLGYELASGAGQLSNANAVGWVNVDTISIVFSKPVSGVALASLLLGDSGNNGGTPSGITVSGETNQSTTVATFTLSGPLAANKYYLDLAAAGITDAAGADLDGEWITGTSTFAAGSGDGAPGGDFVFRFNVLPGDVNRDGKVSGVDVNLMRTQPPSTDNATNWIYDLNGDGKVNGVDVNVMRSLSPTAISSFPEPVLPASIPSITSWTSTTFDSTTGTGDGVVLDSVAGGTVNLDGVSPSLADLTFDSMGGYTIAQGSGGTLQLDNGDSPATLIVAAGSDTINAPVLLDSSVLVLPAAGSQLTISGGISGAGQSLTVDDQGTVVLTGTNSYSGGTMVSAGTLITTNPSAIAANTSLTIGAGGTFIFDPSCITASNDTTTASAATSAAASSGTGETTAQPSSASPASPNLVFAAPAAADMSVPGNATTPNLASVSAQRSATATIATSWPCAVNGDGKASAAAANILRLLPRVTIGNFPEPILPTSSSMSSPFGTPVDERAILPTASALPALAVDLVLGSRVNPATAVTAESPAATGVATHNAAVSACLAKLGRLNPMASIGGSVQTTVQTDI